MTHHPHEVGPIVHAGAPVADATGIMILLHGRGGSAQDILDLGRALVPAEYALLAPEADQHTWYPNSFLAPRIQNEPYLSAALSRITAIVESCSQAGVAGDRIFVAGFSQGACLATEFVGRHPQRYGGLLAFTGGLIGPPGEPIALRGDLAGTPVLFSSGDPDPHVPWARVEQSAALLQGIGGSIALRRYPGRPHTVSAVEMAAAKERMGW